jgi:hypothetical protein
MADADACDLIEEWAQGALDLPDDAVVRVSSAGDGYKLVIELPEGEGAQQDAEELQSTVVSAVEADPTLGGRLSDLTVSPAGVDLVAFGETGAQSMFELVTSGGSEEGEDEGEESDDDDGDETNDKDDKDDGNESDRDEGADAAEEDDAQKSDS